MSSRTRNDERPVVDRRVPARDGYPLAVTVYPADPQKGVALVNSATAVPRSFYRHFAAFLREHGWTAVTYDYRGVGESRPANLRGFDARMRDWAFLDMASVLDFARDELSAERLVAVGHSFGGQAAGLLDNAHRIDAMVCVSAQSGYWADQGGLEPIRVGLGVWLVMPLVSAIMGYFPWSRLVGGEDLPKGVAREWSRWARHPKYLLGDDSLPLDRYASFAAPVLAYSIDDDNWGTPRAVDRMMRAYPAVERRHIVPAEHGLDRVGHMGFFRAGSRRLWPDVAGWIEGAVARQPQAGDSVGR